MTIIIGLEDKNTGSVWMGGDSAITVWPNIVEASREKKIFKLGDVMLLGSAGTLRTTQIIRHGLSAFFRFQFPEESVMDYLVNGVAEPMRNALKECGASKIEANEEMSQNWWLLAYKGKVFEIDGGFSISNSTRGYTAIGSGRDYAMGAMLALKDLEPKQRIMTCLKITGEFDSFVKPPYYVMELTYEKTGRNRSSK